MKFLFVHQNFPGQYRHVALALVERGHTVLALGEKPNVDRQRDMAPSVKRFAYPTPRPIRALAETHLGQIAAHIARGRTVARAVTQLRGRGFVPDVVCAHIGWGEALFLKDALPEAKLQLYCEFFYAAEGADAGFDPEFSSHRQVVPARLSTRVRNASLLMAVHAADAGIAPTEWQRSRFPAIYRPKIRLVHDGIDTVRVRPAQVATFDVPGTQEVLDGRRPVVTYVARNLEPYRGFHVFMRALPEIQRRLPDAMTVIVGGDNVSYSARLPKGQSYRKRALAEVAGRLDMSRVRFIPWLPFDAYVSLLQISAAHVYLTYPFVLSWSLLEAMSAGCVVVASRTAPVEEVIKDGRNGFLVDFFSPGEIAARVALVVERRNDLQTIRRTARQTIKQHYDLMSVCLPKQVTLLEGLATPHDRSRKGASSP